MRSAYSSRRSGKLLVTALGTAAILLASLTVTSWILVPVLFVAAWSLYSWYTTVTARQLPHLDVPPELSVRDDRLAVVIEDVGGSLELLGSSLASALTATPSVFLFTDRADAVSLASTYDVTCLGQSTPFKDLDSRLLPAVDVIFPIQAGYAVHKDQLLGAAELLRDQDAVSLSGQVLFDESGAYVQAYAADTLTRLAQSSRAHGSAFFIYCATVLSRRVLEVPEASWAKALARLQGQSLATDLALVSVCAPASARTFWARRLRRVSAATYSASVLLRSRPHSFALPVLASALRGWPLLVLFLLPAAVAYEGDFPSRILAAWFLLAAFAVPLIAWAADLFKSGSWKLVNLNAVSVLYEIPVSLAATPSIWSSSIPRSSAASFVPSVILTVMGLLSALGAGAGFALASLSEVDYPTRSVAAFLATVAAISAFAAALSTFRLSREDRASVRFGTSLQAEVRRGSSSTSSPLLDVSYSGALLAADDSCSLGERVTLLAGSSSFEALVVRSDYSGVALRMDSDPSTHVRWAEWVSSQLPSS